ncbi:MAG: formylglycine-generating enzyme family protein [Myxococcota bacterium]
MTHPLARGAPPLWASEWGEDGFGPFVAFEVEGVVQRMRWIRKGTFWMGSPDEESGRRDDEARHLVTLPRGFWLADTPVTQALWETVMGDNPSRFRLPLRPVEQVNCEEAQAFCKALDTRVPGLNPRLPTEAEWERACRAGTETATWIGDLELLGERNAPLLDSIAWYGGNSGVNFDLEEGHDSARWDETQYAHKKAGTRKVALKDANPWGLYDMLGNVYEWCADVYERQLHTGRRRFSVYTDNIEGSLRVIRGGSWLSLAGSVRAAYRDAFETGFRRTNLGFRVAGGPAPIGGAQEAEPTKRSGDPTKG